MNMFCILSIQISFSASTNQDQYKDPKCNSWPVPSYRNTLTRYKTKRYVGYIPAIVCKGCAELQTLQDRQTHA
jgi:hypothetical protein